MRLTILITILSLMSITGWSQNKENIRFLGGYSKDEKNLYVDFLRIDSVVIETIAPFDMVFGGFSVSRKHFSEVFDYLTKQGVWETYKFKIIAEKERMYFSVILNNLTPYEKSKISIYPDEVQDNPDLDWLHVFNQGKHLSNDPLELRTRIRIYFRDGDIVTGFASSTSLDILNYRYSASSLSRLIGNYVAYFPQDNLLRNK